MIEIKTSEEISKIRIASRIVAKTLNLLRGEVRAGVSTARLDEIAKNFIEKNGAKPAFLNYRGYPATICASINDEIVHGIPSDSRKLKDGDILSIDMGCVYQGFYGDAAITVGVGNITKDDSMLIEVTEKSLDKALSVVKEGITLGDLGYEVEKFVAENGMSVVRNYTGHGIGRALHEEPSIPNFGTRGTGIKLFSGMTLAIEPMVCFGGSDNFTKEDGWTVITKDGSRSAHFEHDIRVTENGCEILSAE